MADPILVTVDSRPPAATLTGAELVPLVQGGVLKRGTAQDIANLAGAGASAAGAPAWQPLPLVVPTEWALLNAISGSNWGGPISLTANRSAFMPFAVGRAINVTMMMVRVIAAIAGSTIDVAIYRADSNMLPGQLVALVTGLNSAVTGDRESGVLSVELSAGLYFFGVRSALNPSIMSLPAVAVPSFGTFGGSGSGAMATMLIHESSALTDPAPSALTLAGGITPSVYVRFT